MNDESLEQIEHQIASLRPRGDTGELRAAVLRDVERELRAGRWDRQLGQAAGVLLVFGVALNVSVGLRGIGGRGVATPVVAESDSRQQSLVETAVLIAEATDAATGSQFARQLAAWSGRELTADEAAAIDAAVGRIQATTGDDNGHKG